MQADANKAMAHLGNSISQYAIQNAILQSKVENMQEEIERLEKENQRLENKNEDLKKQSGNDVTEEKE